jgi:hypothetical protein
MMAKASRYAPLLLLAVLLAPPVAAYADESGAPSQRSILLSLKDAMGGTSGNYFVPNTPVAIQFAFGLGGPPSKTIPNSDGTFLISACRYHSCQEKAAVVADKSGKVRTAALIHFACHFTAPRQIECAHEPGLTIFSLVSKPSEIDIAAMRGWAKQYGVSDAGDLITVGNAK